MDRTPPKAAPAQSQIAIGNGNTQNLTHTSIDQSQKTNIHISGGSGGSSEDEMVVVLIVGLATVIFAALTWRVISPWLWVISVSLLIASVITVYMNSRAKTMGGGEIVMVLLASAAFAAASFYVYEVFSEGFDGVPALVGPEGEKWKEVFPRLGIPGFVSYVCRALGLCILLVSHWRLVAVREAEWWKTLRSTLCLVVFGLLLATPQSQNAAFSFFTELSNPDGILGS